MNKTLSDKDLEQLERILSDFELRLNQGDLSGARSAIDQAQKIAGPEDPNVCFGRSLLAEEAGDAKTAIRELTLALASDPDFADAHYELGLVFEQTGDMPSAIPHFLRTRELDTRLDKECKLDQKAAIDRIERVARETVDALLPELAERLRDVPILLEPRPSQDLVETGFDPRAFGLFEGREHGCDDVPEPTCIVLYTSNLLAEFAEDDLEKEVENTVMHEVGHFFGLDENDLIRLGLD